MEEELLKLERAFADAIIKNVRVYGESAVVTAITSTKGKFRGQEFSTRERATDVFVKREGRWQCVLTHLTRLPEK